MLVTELDGIGPMSLVPTLQTGAMSTPQTLTPEEGFVLSRVDGRTTLGEVCLLVPFPRAETATIIRRLWHSGVVAFAGLTPPVAVAPPTPVAPTPVPVVAALNEDGSLTVELRQRIDDFFLALDQKDAFGLLEVERTADDRTIRRAYFKLSKEFHPDRFFGKPIGEYRDRLAAVFRALKSAHALVETADRRTAYIESLSS